MRSLARGLAVLTAFDEDHPEMTLSQVAERTGQSRASARRFLHTLVALGYVRVDGRMFRLTPQVLRLGTAYLLSLKLPQLAQPHLERLSDATGQSVSAAILDGHDIVYIARVAKRRIMNVDITVGTRFPAYATSMGRVLLAGMSDAELERYFKDANLQRLTEMTLVDPDDLRKAVFQVRQQGWAFVDEELEVGLRSVAAPIHDGSGGVVAAINVSMAAASDPIPYLDPLLAAADALSTDLRPYGMVNGIGTPEGA